MHGPDVVRHKLTHELLEEEGMPEYHQRLLRPWLFHALASLNQGGQGNVSLHGLSN